MDLLGNLSDDQNKSSDVLDLLDGMDESGGKAFVPEQAGDGIQGTVKAVSETSSDYTKDPVPVVNLVNARVIVGGKDVSDESDEWRVTGFQSVLRREIADAKPAVGDLFASKYFGQKSGKGDNKYHHYKVAVRKA